MSTPSADEPAGTRAGSTGEPDAGPTGSAEPTGPVGAAQPGPAAASAHGPPSPPYPPHAPQPAFAAVPREPWVNPARRRGVLVGAVVAALVLFGGGFGIGYAVAPGGHDEGPFRGGYLVPGRVGRLGLLPGGLREPGRYPPFGSPSASPSTPSPSPSASRSTPSPSRSASS